MKKLLKLSLAALTVLALMIAVVGCGGEKTAATDSEQGQNEVKEKLIVAFEPTFAPFESTDENGEFVGFDIDLIKAIAEEQGIEIELKSLGFDGLIPALQTGQIDIAISGMTIKPEREEKVSFSLPYYEAGLIMAVRSDNNEITKPEDLAGKTIAVQIGTTGADKANEFKEKYGAKVKTYNTTDLVFMELINGGADAVINDIPVTKHYIAEKGKDKVKLVGDLLQGEYYGIAVAKNNTELLETINDGLLKLKENGKFAELYKKWFGYEPPEYLPGSPS
ncbi:MAG: basic amino acid ABC transporter substrate-binding protein [Desulfotomaculum sp.]|nr:basic amino acid ABC transporter substrate-binding protein [Desulfotomaculum sp.]